MKQVFIFFRKHFLIRDTIFSIILFYGLVYFLEKYFKKDLVALVFSNYETLFPIFFNSSITLLGFLLTGLSVLLIFLDKEKLGRLKSAGHYKSIFAIYFNAILFCGLFAGTSFWGLLVTEIKVCQIICPLLFLLTARIWRCIWIIKILASIIYKNN